MAYDEPDDPTGLNQVDDMTIGAEVNNDDQQDASDSLEDSATGDPLDTGILPTDRWLAADKFGTTEAEEEAGESLDQHLAEEIPDIDPYAEAEREDEEADTEDDLLEEEDLPDPPRRAGWWPRTRERTRTRRRISSPATSGSTPGRPGPRRPPCTSSTRTRRSRAARLRRLPAVARRAPAGPGPGGRRDRRDRRGPAPRAPRPTASRCRTRRGGACR